MSTIANSAASRKRLFRPDIGASPVWRRLEAVFSGGVRQRITILGYTFSAIILVVGLAAFLSANNLLFLILALLLAVLLVSGFVSRMGLAGLELELTLPEHLTARQNASARAQVRNIKPWMPSFSIRLLGAGTNAFPVDCYFPVIPGATAIGEMIPVLFPRRGSYRDNSFQFLTRFPFGFTERRVRVPLRGEVIVYPSIAPQPAFENLLAQLDGDMAAQRRGQGTDFHRVRPYESGESIRHIDWKSSAHTGKLQLREFTTLDNRTAEIFLDLSPGEGAEFEAWFERAVECSAFLVWHLTRQAVEVNFRTQEVAYTTPTGVDCYTIFKYLATVEPLGTPALATGAPDSAAHVHVALTAQPARWEQWNCPTLPTGEGQPPATASQPSATASQPSTAASA